MKSLVLIPALFMFSCAPKKVSLEDALTIDRYVGLDEELTEDEIEDLPEAGDSEGDNENN